MAFTLKLLKPLTLWGLISKATLYRRKAEGWFVQGTHYVTTGPTNFLWNVEECRKVQGDWTTPEPVQ